MPVFFLVVVGIPNGRLVLTVERAGRALPCLQASNQRPPGRSWAARVRGVLCIFYREPQFLFLRYILKLAYRIFTRLQQSVYYYLYL